MKSTRLPGRVVLSSSFSSLRTKPLCNIAHIAVPIFRRRKSSLEAIQNLVDNAEHPAYG
jgi:hypothetical protein